MKNMLLNNLFIALCLFSAVAVKSKDCNHLSFTGNVDGTAINKAMEIYFPPKYSIKPDDNLIMQCSVVCSMPTESLNLLKTDGFNELKPFQVLTLTNRKAGSDS